MNIYVTGSKGFIGKNLISSLSDIAVEIRSFDIKDDPFVRPKDLNLEGIDTVIHLGAISSTTETDIRKLMDLNLSWSLELIEECKKLKKTNMIFQWASSASVYGKSKKPMKETDVCMPMNHYAMSKYLLEQAIDTQNLDFIWQGFRYFNVYGPYEDHKGNQASPYHQFTEQAKRTGTIKIFEGSENFYRDFVPIDTVCEYHHKFLEKSISGIYNIGSGAARSFLDIAKEIAQLTKARIEYIPFPENLKSHYQNFTQADMSLVNSIVK
jgi:ADP-L-glycero-D-manno-heptose 6-epimerase